MYHNFFVQPELDREMEIWSTKQKSPLFYQPCDTVKLHYKIVTFLLLGFQILGTILELNARNFLEVISKILYSFLMLACYFNEYENFFVVLNINIGFYNMFSELLSLLALYSDKDRILMGFKIISWIYIFLNILPFQYVIPTLSAGHLVLSVNLLSFYVSIIWTSPLLQICNHQLNHLKVSGDCPGGKSISRCIMHKDSKEFQHYITLKHACEQVKLHRQRHQLNKLNLSETAASATAFQTLKCVLTLKRKLKRIRSLKHQHQN